MNQIDLGLHGLKIIKPFNHEDDRGYFSEIWHEDLGLPEFKQINTSVSKLCTFRGLHYQWDKPQGKLIRVTKGSATFFELDIRAYSQTFGKYETINLDSKNNEWLWVPAGFANGFFTLETDTTIVYMCTERWSKNEASIHRSVLDYPFNYFGSIRHISNKDDCAPSFDDSLDHLRSISGFFSDN